MDVDARVIAATQDGFADVDADPDTKVHAARPGVPGHDPLGGHGAVHRLADGWEDRKDRVALAGDDVPPLLLIA